MAIGETVFESDGQAVNVSLSYAVAKDDIVYVESWLGIAANDGASGDTIALSVRRCEVQIEVPAGLSVSKGDTIYIDVASLTGHKPQSGAYATTSGGTKVAFAKAVEAKNGTTNVVRAILL